jgi:hypothetical protein
MERELNPAALEDLGFLLSIGVEGMGILVQGTLALALTEPARRPGNVDFDSVIISYRTVSYHIVPYRTITSLNIAVNILTRDSEKWLVRS